MKIISLPKEKIQRMDGLHNIQAEKDFLKSALVIYEDLAKEGFEYDEILTYLLHLLTKRG